MKLEAAQRLLALQEPDLDYDVKLKGPALALDKFLSSLGKSQRNYFEDGLPYALRWWFLSSFRTKLMVDDITVAAIGNAKQLTRMVTAMNHLRHVIPTITSGTIYRLTALPKDSIPAKGQLLTFNGGEQLRSLTSWTTNKKPFVKNRTSAKPNTKDVILEYKLQGGKHVLFDYKSLSALKMALFNNSEYFERKYAMALDAWYMMDDNIAEFDSEHEVALFLSPSESIQCKWRPASSFHADHDDDYEEDGGGAMPPPMSKFKKKKWGF